MVSVCLVGKNREPPSHNNRATALLAASIIAGREDWKATTVTYPSGISPFAYARELRDRAEELLAGYRQAVAVAAPGGGSRATVLWR